MKAYLSVARIAMSVLILGAVLNVKSISAGEPSLLGSVWALQQIAYNNDTTLQPEESSRYTIEFLEDGTVHIRADCNIVRGTYGQDLQGDFSITPGPSTLAACPPDSSDREFLQALSSAAIYFFRDSDLYLDLKADVGTMQFSPANL